MDHHRVLMDKFLDLLTSSKPCPILKDEKYNAIINTIQHPDKCTNAKLKHQVKSKQYQLMDLPGLGIKNALVVPSKGDKSSGSTSSAFLRVLSESQVYDVMHEIHFRELNHAGYKKCRDYVSCYLLGNYYVLVLYIILC